VYDCHEYERERQGMPKLVKLFVKTFEGVLIPLASQVITVGPSIKKEYERLYGLKNVHLVRNTPHLMPVVKHNKFREVFPIRDDQKIFLYQGMLTPGRGIEIMLETFKLREKQDAVLVIMGHGKMKDLVEQSVAGQDKLFYHPSVPYEMIHTYTSSADVGLNTVQNTSLSYYYCLPNKLFEYIQCGLPILTNALPDCMALVQQEHIGHVIQTYTTAGFNQAIDEMLEQDWREYHQNLARIKPMYQWDVEIEALKNVYSPLL
jgi:glycosyltransferase involved in cell wall biosynthesis